MAGYRVVIVGGGIGGLTAALCLAGEGHLVTVLEQADAFSETGAGIQLSPNCSRVLHSLGLGQDLAGVGFLPQMTRFRHWFTGKVITENTLGEAVREQYGFPYYHVHRGDLLALLLRHCEQQANITLRSGFRVSRIQNNPDGVVASNGAEDIEGDLVVGADGIHSKIRAELWGAEPADFTGNVAWRALVPTRSVAPDLVPPGTSVWWGPKRHFVHYYVRGGELINCVCVVEKTGWEKESWTEQGEQSELVADFAGWHDDIQQLLTHMDPASLYKWALFDRPPMAQWGSGCATLLGDACHPTLPFMAQGAAMAIEDAAVLAACLSGETDPAAALARYESLRRERTAMVQNGSRRNGRVFHLSGIAAWLRDKAARVAQNRLTHELYRYDAYSAVSGLKGE